MCDHHLTPILLPKAVVKDFDGACQGTVYKDETYQEPSVETLVLVPSERCNLRCPYCYEQHKRLQRMDIQIAKEAIRQAFLELKPGKQLKIEFRGGEPFLEFDFIREICEWVGGEYPSDCFSFYAITNGTCFSDEAKQWLQGQKDRFVVPLSIDGGRDTQNRNRSNSFDQIDFDFLFKTWAHPCCITTILPVNSFSLFRDLRFVMDKGFDVRVDFGYTHEWSVDQLKRLSLGFGRFADYALKTRHVNRINLLSRHGFLDYRVVRDEGEAMRRKNLFVCNAGKYRCLVAADGKRYPCQAFVPSAFNLSNDFTDGDMFERLKIEEINPPECCSCPFFDFCHICPGFSYAYAGSFKWRNPSLCAITKIRAFLSAYYWGHLFLSRTEVLSASNDDLNAMKARIADLYRGEKIYE